MQLPTGREALSFFIWAGLADGEFGNRLNCADTLRSRGCEHHCECTWEKWLDSIIQLNR
jgi:hypothetical protein